MTPGSICPANKFWLTHMSPGKKKRTKINKCIKTCYKNIKKKNEVKKSEEKAKLQNLNLTFFLTEVICTLVFLVIVVKMKSF